MLMQKLWFSIYDFSFDYPGPEKPFADPETFPFAKALSSNADVIHTELEEYLKTHSLSGYFNSSMVNRKNSWRTIALKTWSVQLFKNQDHFPKTTALLKKYPAIVSASFNLLEPGARIHPHCGDTNAIYRCHLGLEIPSGLPEVGFRVKEETRPWENNKWLIFMDAYKHEAWNNSDKPRYIFLIDVIREEYMDQKNKVCSTVLTSLFLQKRAEKFHFKLTSAPFLVRAAAFFLQPFARLSIRAVNTFKIY
jgi:aspartyl/asparaginyl beta-hydroxylase (cupin superfamily)